MSKTIEYEVPDFKGSPQLAHYGEWDGNTLLHAILNGDGPAVTEFLAGFVADRNTEFDAVELRYAIVARAVEATTDLAKGVETTGFKAFANPDPKAKYRKPKVTHEGEGCEANYCDLAAKYRLPAPPEGFDGTVLTLACQKHAVEAIDRQAYFVARGGNSRYIYLTSDGHRQIKEAARDALLEAVKAAV